MIRCVPRNVNWKIKASTLHLRSLQAFCRLIGKPRTAPSFLAALGGVCVSLMLPTAQAATLTWAGGASNTWNSTSSWSPAQIPVNGDDLIFNTASANAQNNFANNALTLNSITFNATTTTLSQSATNGILIGAGGVTAAASTGTSAFVLGVTLSANQTWSVGTSSIVTLNRAFAMGNNTLTKTGAGTLRLTNNLGTSSAGSQILVQNGILEALYQNDIRSTTAIVLGGGGNTTQLRITDGNNANRLTNLQSAISIAAGTTGAVTINNAVLSSASDVTLSGNISLGTSTDADLVFNTTTGSVTKLTGTISGSMTNANNRGNIQFSGGNGEVQFNSANNSFSGVRTFGIQQGVVVLGANDPATGSSNGALGNNTTSIFVGTSASPNSGVASLLMDGAFTSGRAITVGNSANANSVTYTLGGRTAHDSVFSGGITLNRDVQLTAANGGNVTFSGILNDAANTQSVTKVGNGTVILTRANTYDGTTTVSAGALTANNSTALGSTTGGTTVSSGAALQLVGGISIGAEALSLTGDGISSGGALRNLSGTNSYAGAITLAGATRINSDAGTLTLGAGGISGTQNLTFGGAGDTSVSGVIGTSTGTLTKDGAGTLTLSGGNTYDGSTTVSAGALTANNASALGSTTGNTTVASGAALQLSGGVAIGAEALSLTGDGISSGGALRNLSGTNSYAGAITLAGATRINSDADTLTLGAGGISGTQSLTFGGAGNITVSGLLGISTGTLTKDGNGILTLGNGTGTAYTGTTTVNAGTLVLSGAAYDNRTTSSSALTIATGATVNATFSGSVYSYFGSLAGNGTLIVGAAGSTNRMQVGFNNSNTTFSGLLNLANSNSFLFKTGTGALTLSGNNTGSIGQLKFGTTSNAANEIVFGHAASPGSMLLGFDVLGTVSASVAGVDLKGGVSFNNNGNFGSATNTNDILVSGAVDLGTATRTITVSNNTTFSGNVTNTAGFTKAGAGTLILSGNSTYSGITTVSNGILRASHANALGATGNGTTVSSGAALELSGGISIGAEALSLTGNGISSTGALRNIIGNNAYGGVISLAGATTIGSDAGNLTLSSGSSITGTNTNLTIVGSGNITINDAIATGSGTLTKNGTGTLTLGGSNSYTGATILNTGNISFSTTAALANSSSLSMANATSLIYTGSAATLDRAISVTSGTGTIRNSGTGPLTLSGALTKNSTTLTLQGGTNGITVSGVISGSANNSDLVIDGGTTTLANSNTYNGPTFIINSGTLNANTAGALPTSTLSAVTINGSSTLALGDSQSVASLSGTSGSTVNLDASTLTINGSATTTYSGGISGTGNLVKNGTGTQTLAGATTFTGNTTVNSGTLKADAANALANTSQVVLNNGGSFLVTAENAVNDDAAIHLNGGRMAMSGNFNETVGALTLSANSTLDFSGFVGTLRFGSIASWAAGANLAIWNWSGRTEYGTNYGTYPNSSNLVFTNNATLTNNLANISFYSDSGITSIGSGFERGFTGGGTEIIAVPETETYFYAVALLAGIVIQYLRRRAKRKSSERQLPAFATRATARQRDRSPG
jgi:autotransporter-associated beta strand protein